MDKLSNAVIVLVVFMGSMLAMQNASAAACSGGGWTPTFVHDLDNPDGPWFVLAGGGFERVILSRAGSYTPHACDQIRAYGVRNRRGFTNCQAYTRVQCGCRRGLSESKPACARFLRTHTSRQAPRANTPGY
ncbi:MAG: hypothetical protein HOM11_01750 [Methylococcales bacterium]|jgi:hypothetical protein|nr:hypothetical protein [Methylococcales bacterium]MBT7445158.1 hypothetical protein [Methylococcales bacterium]